MSLSQSSSNHLLVRAARGEHVERPPVWAMRQAGRWDPGFIRLRGEHTFYEFSENVDLAAQASVLPKRFGVDAIILFYDITSLAVAMGLPFTLQPSQGPIPDRPIQTMADLERVEARPDPERFRHIRELLATVQSELRGELPVIVFAGAPFTLAAYCIATGKDLLSTRRFIKEQPNVWIELLNKLTTATIHFLSTLIREGADIYQLFDSWAGMLDRDEYQRWAQPYHRAIFAGAFGTPRILFVKECPYVDLMAQSGAEVVSLGTSHDLADVRRDYPNLVLQGNVDEKLLREGTPAQVAEATRRCLAAGGGQRHIVNLSHGVDRNTPVQNFEAFVRTAKELLL
jgi:uroporphyrinogen decarboxylase